jgi:hypothetical protein
MKQIFLLIFLLGALASNFAAAETCKVIKSGEKFALHQCDKLKVLFLQGTPEARARMHGELMKKELSRDAMRYFSERIFQEVEDANFLVRGIFKSIYNNWVDRFYKKTPSTYAKEMAAQAEGAEAEPGEIRRSLALPDTSAFLVNMPARGFFNTFVTFGCTSVAKKSADGTFVYGRNLDFASTTIYDKTPLMAVQIPEEGSSELKHIGFGTDGMQAAGITGVNEAGISFAVHQLMSKDAEKFGVPMFFIGEEVLRKAKTLEEAAEIIKANRPGPLWVFVISDLNKQETWSVEVSASQFDIRKMEGDTFAQTNHVIVGDKNMEMANAGFLQNSHIRFDKVMETAKAQKKFTAAEAANLLSFQSDAKGELSSAHDILKGETIQTVILEAKGGKIDIHTSIDPAPVSSGRYAQFDLKNIFSAPKKLSYSISDLSKTPKQKRQNQFKLAKASRLLDLSKYDEAAGLFTGQRTIDSGIMRAVSLYNLEKYNEAEKAATDLKKKADPKELKGQSVLWLEMLSLLKQKKNEQSQKIAKQILASSVLDQDLKSIATKISQGKELEDGEDALRFSMFSGNVTNQIFQ